MARRSNLQPKPTPPIISDNVSGRVGAIGKNLLVISKQVIDLSDYIQTNNKNLAKSISLEEAQKLHSSVKDMQNSKEVGLPILTKAIALLRVELAELIKSIRQAQPKKTKLSFKDGDIVIINDSQHTFQGGQFVKIEVPDSTEL